MITKTKIKQVRFTPVKVYVSKLQCKLSETPMKLISIAGRLRVCILSLIELMIFRFHWKPKRNLAFEAELSVRT